MPLQDDVGGYAEGSGSEETHRPATSKPEPEQGWSATSRLSHLAGSGRFRLQTAGPAAFLLILLVAVAFPARQLRVVTTDGDVQTVSSRSSDAVAAVEQAGIAIEPGDEVEALGDGELIVHRATEAILKVDGQSFAVRTRAETIAELLIDAEVPMEPDDSVLRDDVVVSPDAPVAPQPSVASSDLAPGTVSDEPVVLEVRRAVPFSLEENGQELQLRSSGQTVGSALRDVGVRLGPGDEIQPSPSAELTAGLQIRVEHAQQLVVTLPEGKKILYTLADSVEAALADSGLRLPAGYRLEPSGGTAIGPGLAVHVVGISEDQVLETERIQSQTVYEADPSLAWGETLTMEGRDGVYYRQFLLVYEDGELLSRELELEWYDPEPIDTTIYYSTAAEPTPIPPPPVAQPQPDQPITVITGGAEQWRSLVCAYGWDCEWALAVIQCESGGNPNAYNPGGPYIGLFQIWGGHGPNLYDPAVNIAAAYSLYLSGGAGHWPYCP